MAHSYMEVFPSVLIINYIIFILWHFLIIIALLVFEVFMHQLILIFFIRIVTVAWIVAPQYSTYLRFSNRWFTRTKINFNVLDCPNLDCGIIASTY